MNSLFFSPFIAIGLWLLSAASQAQMVLEDGNVGFDQQELEQIISSMPVDMRRSAANDLGDRMEILNIVLVNRKMALEVEKLTPKSDPEAYWAYQSKLQAMQRQLVFDQYIKNLEVPDMAALSEERYITEKDKYALVPEKRSSSHILFLCEPGCDRAPFKLLAGEVLAQLRAGADFEEMVETHSTDPGSKNNKGKLDRWMGYGEAGITPNYSAGLFAIKEIGGYSDVVETEFGLHIIRLDAIRESYYRPYEEVSDDIVKALHTEYLNLAAKEFKASFKMTDDVRIDGPAMDEIFDKYKTLAD